MANDELSEGFGWVDKSSENWEIKKYPPTIFATKEEAETDLKDSIHAAYRDFYEVRQFPI